MQTFRKILVLLALLSVVASQNCQKRKGCASCVDTDGCGWCGLYTREGVCGRGSLSGPRDFECDARFWRYEGGNACTDVFRQVNITESDEKVTFTSILVGGETAEDAQVDAYYVQFSHELDDDNRRHADTVVAYGSGDLDAIEYQIYVVAFDTIIEYNNNDNNKFDCNSTQNLGTCPEAFNILQVYNISDFEPVEYTISDGVTDFQKLYTSTQRTTDGKVNVTCHGSNGDFGLEGFSFSEYQWKCDVTIQDFSYTGGVNSSLALGSWVAGAEVDDVLSDPDDQEMGEIDFTGVGYFQWNPQALADGVSVPVQKTEILIVDESVDLDPDADVYATFFSFLDNSQPTRIFWDPLYTVEGRNFTFDDGANGLRPGLFDPAALQQKIRQMVPVL